MKRIIIGASLCLSAMACAGNEVLHFSLQKLDRQGFITTYFAQKTLVNPNTVQANFSTEVPYPTIYFRLPPTVSGANKGQDWSTYTAFVFSVENTSATPVLFKLRLDDHLTLADGVHHCQHGWAVIDGYSRQDFAFPLNVDPSVFGMKAIPGIDGANWLQYNTAENVNLNRANVTRFLFFTDQPAAPLSLRFGSPRLVRANINMNGISDKYGQFSRTDWPGKMYTLSDFSLRDFYEQLDLTANPPMADRDEWGGYAGSPNYGATGRFRTLFTNGKWWLVNPSGHLHIAIGMDTVTLGEPTITTGRENMFTDLPASPSDPLYQFYAPWNGKTTYNHYDANLFRKYGPDYQVEADQRALDRLESWGFNLMGNWTHYRMWEYDRMAHTVGIAVERKPNGTDCNSFTVDTNRKKMYDVFDPNFETMILEQGDLVPNTAYGSPFTFGWYVDNEPTFIGDVNTEEGGRYGLAYAVMRRPASTWYCKAEFISDLKAKYGTIGALNAAWNTTFASWAAAEGNVNLSGPSTEARKVDFKAFITKFARSYFLKCYNMVKAYDPQGLYLGCRFFRTSPEILTAASEFCDVLSFNIYADGIDTQWASTLAIYNKPLMVSEFHFGALDRGTLSGGLVNKGDQPARGGAYGAYVETVIQNPLFIGATYHQMQDSPLTGRRVDGENYGIGFVNGCDNPYPEMVDAARANLGGMYERRFYY